MKSYIRLVWVFIFIFVICLAAAAGATYASFVKPWRVYEIWIIVLVFILTTISIGIFAYRCRFLLTFLGLCAGIGVTADLVLYGEKLLTAVQISYLNIPSLIKNRKISENLFVHFKYRPKISTTAFPNLIFADFNDPYDREVADRLMRNEYSFWWQEWRQLPKDLNWDEDPFDDGSWGSWNWALQNMNYVLSLVNAFEATKELSYLKRADELIFDWIEDNSVYFFPAPSSFAWSDHSTALRMSSWLPFWEVWIKSPLADPEKAEMLLKSIIVHALKLSDSSEYKEKNNHGIDQDIALYSIAKTFPEISLAENWAKLAEIRLLQQIDLTISSDGIHMEHSPGYHLTTFLHLRELNGFSKALGFEEFSEPNFIKLLSKMETYLTQVTKPDGQLAPIGDTFPGIRPSDYGISTASTERFTVFSKDGYGVLRDYVKLNNYELFLLFNAASNDGLIHKHHDDLSVLLYACGRDILIDPGGYSYRRNKQRRFFVSWQAHSTVFVGRPELEARTFVRGDGLASLSGAELAQNYSVLQGRTSANEGSEFRRTIFYFGGGTLIVVDQLFGLGGHSRMYHQAFQFAPDLAVGEEGLSMALQIRDRNGAEIASVRQLAERQIEAVEVLRGEMEPLLGWTSANHDQIIPTHVAIFSQRGVDALFVTEITLDEQCLPPGETGEQKRVRIQDVMVESQKTGVHIIWDVQGKRWIASVDRDGKYYVVGPEKVGRH